MTQATPDTMRLDNGTRSPMRRLGLLVVGLACVAALCLLGAGCGGHGSAAVANVSSTTSADTNVASTTTYATPSHDGSGAGGSSEGGPSVASRGGGNRTVINVGNAVQGAKFAACIRRNGLPSFPDPNPQGMIQFGSGIDPHSPVFGSAFSACRKLLPSGFGQPPTQAQLNQLQQQLLAFSTCMRTHGITNFPDPNGGGLPQIQPIGDLDPSNPQFQTAYIACKAHLPAGVPAKALGGLAPPATSP